MGGLKPKLNIGLPRSIFHWLFGEEDWSLWIGRKGSTTALHKDHMHFNYLYVVQGLKRVVLIPEEEKRKYECDKVVFDGFDCWPEIDVLTDTSAKLN